MATSFPGGLDALTNPTSGDSLSSPSHSAQHANVNDAVEALEAKVGINGSTIQTSLDYKLRYQTLPVFIAPKESWYLSNIVSGGFALVESQQGTAHFFPVGGISADFPVMIRHSYTSSLNVNVAIGESITFVLAVENGATAYYPTSFYIDSTLQTVKWQGGAAPSAGTADSIDVYVLTIIKTAGNTYTVLGSQTAFA